MSPLRFTLPAGWLCLLAFAVAGLAGCSSLPTVLPYDDAPSTARTPVQLETARGPLSPAQSKLVLQGLAARGKDTGIFERHLAVEEAIVGSPLTTGNRVSLLVDGPATYRAMFAAIQGARDHINMETYILENDDVGHKFAQALIAKQRAGVQVNLIHDSVGTIGTPKDFFQRLSDAGINVLEFNPVNPATARKGWELNQRDHRKLLIVDGRIAFLGGINISSVYSGGSFKSGSRGSSSGKDAGKDPGPPWRDTDLQVEGPAVAELQRLFLSTWVKQKGDPLMPRNYFPPPQTVGQQVVRAIGSSPDEPYALIYATLLSAIGAAETSIHLTNAYFAPDPQLLAALEAAASRGVAVKMILPSQTDSWLIFHAGRNYYEQLLRAGVKIYERRGVILHAKTALIDGVWATVGSTNLDWRSFLHNDELNAVVLGPDFGSQVQALFDKDLAESDEITLEAWERRPIGPRMKEILAKMWEYWL
ncbi:MAG TPA: phospholipase D-like domain-containing protein [Rhizobacter sp.]|nr:phospholipase D-like domain-containing protein [Rhizobacter sp.]